MADNGDDLEQWSETITRSHKSRVREVVWTPKEQRQEVCARCTLKRKNIVTLVMAGEQFGLCERCLEALWNLAFHDE